MAQLQVKEAIISETAQVILDKTKAAMGFVPNMYQDMAANASLMDAYAYSYSSFRKNAGFSPVEQEVIFLSVAVENGCEYCVAAHSFVGDNLSQVPVEITDAIRNNQPINDRRLSALSTLARKLTGQRGRVSQSYIDGFLAEGYTPAHILGIITAIGIKTMSNYSNHLTDPELDAVFIGRKWAQ